MSPSPKSCTICGMEAWHLFGAVAAVASAIALLTWRVSALEGKVEHMDGTLQSINIRLLTGRATANNP